MPDDPQWIYVTKCDIIVHTIATSRHIYEREHSFFFFLFFLQYLTILFRKSIISMGAQWKLFFHIIVHDLLHVNMLKFQIQMTNHLSVTTGFATVQFAQLFLCEFLECLSIVLYDDLIPNAFLILYQTFHYLTCTLDLSSTEQTAVFVLLLS